MSQLTHLKRRSAATVLTLLLAVGGQAHGDDAKEGKARPKPKPIKLAAAKITPGQTPGAATRDSTFEQPNFDFDPNLPSYLRPVRLFNKEGRYIDARLLSASGETVTVQRLTDNQTFDVAMGSLDEASLQRVEKWMDRDPEAINFSIAFDVKKRFVDSDDFATLGRDFKTMRWAYDVVMTNQSRNELRNAELEYQIIYEDQVEFVRTSAYPGKGKNQREGRSVDIPPLAFNGRAEFSTPPVTMEIYEYAPTRGDREYRRDQILGIWIRLFKNGEVIAEYQSHPASMTSLTWEEEDEIEIVVKDSFRDQFETGE